MFVTEGKRKMKQRIIPVILLFFMLCLLIAPVSAAQSNASGMENNATITATPVQFPTTFT
jgi:hypothetical protein